MLLDLLEQLQHGVLVVEGNQLLGPDVDDFEVGELEVPLSVFRHHEVRQLALFFFAQLAVGPPAAFEQLRNVLPGQLVDALVGL